MPLKKCAIRVVVNLIVLIYLSSCAPPPLAQPATRTFVTAVATTQPTISVTSAATLTSTNTPSVTCSEVDDSPANYDPQDAPYTNLDQTGFSVDGNDFIVYGANYYPRNAPMEQFLKSFDSDAIQSELDLMADSGLNTLRIFLHHRVLFACDGQSDRPRKATFENLDTFISLADANSFKLVVVLHADLAPYEQEGLALSQTQYILTRYQNEPTIIAWDLRDRGDVDYASGNYDRTQVLEWLARASAIARQLAPNHAITVGWWNDTIATIPYVDFVSFQHYGEYLPLRETIANLRASTNKPILLAAIGYSTQYLDETAQRNLLFQAFEEVRFNQLLGWTIYMAFDYPLSMLCPDGIDACDESISSLQRYGVWNTSYFPKLAVDAIERITSSN